MRCAGYETECRGAPSGPQGQRGNVTAGQGLGARLGRLEQVEFDFSYLL